MGDHMISFIANLILCVLFAIFFMYLFGWWLIPALAVWGLIVLAEGGKRLKRTVRWGAGPSKDSVFWILRGSL